MGFASQAIVGLTIAFSYTLVGNAITQSFMGVPALLIDFPPPTSPSHPAAARHLGRQWPVFWAVGNVFFRPISTFGILGYAFAAYSAFTGASSSPTSSTPGFSTAYAAGREGTGGVVPGDWRLYAVGAACHLVTVVHSAVNMQPINAKIDGLKSEGASTAELEKAEYWARRWARLNLVRLVMPLVAGSLALSQALKV